MRFLNHIWHWSSKSVTPKSWRYWYRPNQTHDSARSGLVFWDLAVHGRGNGGCAARAAGSAEGNLPAMSKTIVIVDDDQDDLDMLVDAAKTLFMDNSVRTFTSAEEALEFLKDTTVQPLFILCDVNMPQMVGIAFRQAIYRDEELRFRSIPFLFLSTAAYPDLIREAYQLAVHGYFKKPTSYKENSRNAQRDLLVLDTVHSS